MELGLSLGSDALKQQPPPFEMLKQNNNSADQKHQQKFDFSMALSLNNASSNTANHRELTMMKAQKSQENDDDDDDNYDIGDDHTSEDDDCDNSEYSNHLQLNLLTDDNIIVPRKNVTSSSSQLKSLPWSSSDNVGSSENGSSGNMGPPASMAMKRPAEEVSSSASSFASTFRIDLGVYATRNGQQRLNPFNDKIRRYEATTSNDVVERASSRAISDEDDENGLNGTRKKLRLSKEQSAFLEESFKEHHTLNPKQKLALSKQLNLRPRQVEVWFQNRRARTKLKQTEVDCEYLKRCCETLTEENRKLHKELQELRALKTSNQLHMHMPATTLTMCPSCERVATTTNDATSGKPGAVDHRPRFFPFSDNQSHQDQPTCSLMKL